MVLTTDIVAHLVADGIGVAGEVTSEAKVSPSNATIFEGQMPGEPDDCVSVFAYGGTAPSVDWEGEFPSVQVRVRAASHADAYNKAYAAMLSLHRTIRTTINGSIYYWIEAKQSPSSLGRDPKGRSIYVVNFDVMKERGA